MSASGRRTSAVARDRYGDPSPMKRKTLLSSASSRSLRISTAATGTADMAAEFIIDRVPA
jgi:hypothetical protein